METKKTSRADLEKYKGLFLVLGLILSLSIVYFSLQLKTYSKSKSTPIVITSGLQEEEEKLEEFIIEEIVNTPPESQHTLPDVIEIVEDNNDVVETIIESTETDESDRIVVQDVIIDNELVEVEEEEIIVEDIPFAIIEDVPIYPGCEKFKDNEAQKECLNRSLQEHVAKKFNSNLASDLGLSKGKKKIYVKFKITQTGDIEIVGARAPHTRLEKEAKRVVDLIPKMIPGKQRGRPVNVTYMLPISFEVR